MAAKAAQKDKLTTIFMLILSVALISYILSLFDLFQLVEYKIYDLTFQRRGPVSIHQTGDQSEIVIVTIDQETADSLSFPFDRKNYATLIDKLCALGAKRIVIDVDFSSRGAIPASDSLFRQAITRAGNVVLIGKIEQQRRAGIVGTVQEVKPPSLSVANPGTEWGLVNEFVDPDGVTRRYGLFLTDRNKTYLSVALKVYALEKKLGNQLPDSVTVGDFRYGGLSVPRADLNTTLLNYYGPAATFSHYSFLHIVRGEYDSEYSPEQMAALKDAGVLEEVTASPFQGKIVMVGASAEDLQDNKFTPFFDAQSPIKTPGVEVHANALKMFFDQSFIRVIGLWWIISAILVIATIAYLIGRTSRGWIGILVTAGLIIAIAAYSTYLFSHWRIWLPVVPLVLAIVIGYPTNLVYRFIKAQKEKAMIRGMFAQYVPKKVVGELINNPDLMKLGGEKRRMSVLFTDVAGFTTVSEGLSPEALVALLNEYLTAMTRVILDHDGIIDKYEGDLVMAEFGAPVWYPDHAVRCCRAALGMQKRLAELREKWRSEGRNELYSRVGINTGDMIVGNMGSEEVFDYTVMGDAVNLSSRLEGANKNYKTTIMIGHETWKDVKDHFVTRPLDLLQVKGKNEPVPVYELIGELKEKLPTGKSETLELYGEGCKLYRQRDFAGALEFFRKACAMTPDDGPSNVYLTRCEMFIENPPPPDWDGVFTLTEK